MTAEEFDDKNPELRKERRDKAKAKARELYDQYFSSADNMYAPGYISGDKWKHSKRCVVIACDQALNLLGNLNGSWSLYWVSFWKDVREEAELIDTI